VTPGFPATHHASSGARPIDPSRVAVSAARRAVGDAWLKKHGRSWRRPRLDVENAHIDPTSITIAIPVSDLSAATAWYDAVFDRRPELEPVPGIVEYEFGGTWIQLVGDRGGSRGWMLRYGVADLQRERDRLISLGVSVEEVETVPGVISFFDFSDPDGNGLSCYQVSPA
jgi:predicted enzyme related to lactoylglutathione lyase